MKNQNYEHQKFIQENELLTKDLSKPVQKMIQIFNVWEVKKKDTVGKDLKTLTADILDLDLEILEAIQEDFEDALVNNDLVEELDEEPKKSNKKKTELFQLETQKERVIRNLYESGERKVSRNKLVELGITEASYETEMVFGDYGVVKFRGSYNYSIHYNHKED